VGRRRKGWSGEEKKGMEWGGEERDENIRWSVCFSLFYSVVDGFGLGSAVLGCNNVLIFVCIRSAHAHITQAKCLQYKHGSRNTNTW
jgi:hypothetical protein